MKQQDIGSSKEVTTHGTVPRLVVRPVETQRWIFEIVRDDVENQERKVLVLAPPKDIAIRIAQTDE